MKIGMPALDSRFGVRVGVESCFPCQNHFSVGFRRGASLFRRGIWNPMPNPMPKQIWRGIWKSAWDSALDLEIGVGFGVAFMFRRGIRRGILISAWDEKNPCQNLACKSLWVCACVRVYVCVCLRACVRVCVCVYVDSCQELDITTRHG